MKCPSCEAEWQTGKSASVLATCPFCGASLAPQKKEEPADTSTIQGVLRTLVQERGVALYKKENSGQLKALLSDVAVDFPRERKVLGVVLTEGVQERLLKADGGTDYEKHDAAAWCRLHLTEELAMMEDRATEAVNILAAGLGWEPPLEPTPAASAQPQSAPQQPAPAPKNTPQPTPANSTTSKKWLTIEQRAVTRCSKYAEGAIVIPGGVTKIEEEAFRSCKSISSVTIPDGVTEIGDGAFAECTSLASVTIPDGVTKIGAVAFCECTSLASVTIPDSVTKIGDGAFGRCTSLASVTIPDGVTKIGAAAFSECTSLASVTIPDSVTEIGYGVFVRCTSLASVTIPDGVTKIGEVAFGDCTSLASVTIPGSITLGRYVFAGCTSLHEIHVRGNPSKELKKKFEQFGEYKKIKLVQE